MKQRIGQLRANTSATAFAHSVVRMAGHVLSLYEIENLEELRRRVKVVWEDVTGDTSQTQPRCILPPDGARSKTMVTRLNDVFSGFMAVMKRTPEDSRKRVMLTEVVQAYYAGFDYINMTVNQMIGKQGGIYLGPTWTREQSYSRSLPLISIEELAGAKEVRGHAQLGQWVSAFGFTDRCCTYTARAESIRPD